MKTSDIEGVKNKDLKVKHNLVDLMLIIKKSLLLIAMLSQPTHQSIEQPTQIAFLHNENTVDTQCPRLPLQQPCADPQLQVKPPPLLAVPNFCKC